MTDEELDREWKPNGRRPQSTIARSFSQELVDIFRIDDSITDLNEKLDKRKQQISSQASELEAIEARIREMEKRLRSSSQLDGGSLDQRLAPAAGPSSSLRGQRPPAASNFDRPPSSARDHPASFPPPGKDYARRSAQGQLTGASRPGTARQSQQAAPGALPPTPVASEDGDGE